MTPDETLRRLLYEASEALLQLNHAVNRKVGGDQASANRRAGGQGERGPRRDDGRAGETRRAI